jgi:hypothetical protein
LEVQGWLATVVAFAENMRSPGNTERRHGLISGRRLRVKQAVCSTGRIRTLCERGMHDY